MTAEPDLLPLRDWMECLGEANAEDIRDYARANVAHATAAKDAEIADLMECNRSLMDALNVAELSNEELRAEAIRTEAELHQQAEQAEARAERLAEALRGMREYVTAALQDQHEAFAGHEDSSDIPGIEADLHKIDTLLREQENDDA